MSLSKFTFYILAIFAATARSETSLAVQNLEVPVWQNNHHKSQQAVIGFQPLPPLPPRVAEKEKTPSIRKVSEKATVAFAMLLASSSGLLNGACLSGMLSSSGSGQAVAAATASFTNAAVGLASRNSGLFLQSTKCVLSLLGGSALAGIIVPRPAPYQLQNPRSMAFAFACGSAFLILARLNAVSKGSNYLFLCLAANGLQNSISSTFTSNLCRTTHFTGMISDIGTFLGQILRGNLTNLHKLKVLLLVACSFWTGAALSHPLTMRYSSGIFLVSASIFMAVASTLLMLDSRRIR